MKRIICFILAIMLMPIFGCSKVNEEEQSTVPAMEPPIVVFTPEPTVKLPAGPTTEPTIAPEPTPVSTEEPEPSEAPVVSPWINPEIGKHEVNITIVAVENPDPYEIKQISETPFVQTEGWVSDFAVATFWKFYEMLPDSIRANFESDGFKVMLTKKNLDENYYAGDVDGFINGVFSYERKTIFFYGTDAVLQNAFFHEFGHYLDWKNGFSSRSDAFKTIYEAEKGTMNDASITDSTEFFAEVFQEMMLNNADDYPNTTAFIRSLIHSN